jgi:hypothetical protein
MGGEAASQVTTSNGSNFDGPAELPRIYLQTMMADTPAPGTTLNVNSAGDLQAALDNASCGDTISLQAGGTFEGKFTFPAKTCDSQHWIIVRTSTPDANLPPEGTRMTPCLAGVSSLPARPPFACAAPSQLLATVLYTGTGNGPIQFAPGANHYRFIGLEVTRGVGGKPVTALVAPVGSADSLIFDRLYIHGTPEDETRRGIALGGSTNVAVLDSYFSDFHCVVGGTCTDSQAVSGGTGSLPMGPYKIVDNFLEAAGENILFGGGAATLTPADIEIRQNHLFKPMTWMRGTPGFLGVAMIVKNHLELKNAQRVLVDSNLLEDSWGGFSQAGFSVVITPKNQDLVGQSVCPLCQVTDVTIRNARISHVGGVFQIANVLSPSGGAPLDGQRYSIHDVIADDIDGTKYIGHGIFAQISTVASPLLQHVHFDHITAFPPHMLLNVGGPNNAKILDFTFVNSIVSSGEFPIWSTGAFGLSDCAHFDVPLITLNQCFSSSQFAPNLILDTPSAFPPSRWPGGNIFYGTPAIQFVSFGNGIAGDYHLLPGSPAKGVGSDGQDLGANVDAVLGAISAIQ